MNLSTKVASPLVNVQVKRRAHIPTHGWNFDNKPTAYIPTLEELVYDIYDSQREIIGGMFPKRFNSKIMTPIKNIERLYHMKPSSVDFDGMTHQQASKYFMHKALEVGIRNEFSIPFIFAKQIRVRSAAFSSGYSHIFITENGLRYQIQGTIHEFHYMANKRVLASNLSYHLNLKYNCNLHIANDEAQRVFETTGKWVENNRHLFVTACDYYLNPQRTDIVTFMRAQVKELRKEDTATINQYIFSTDALLETDPKLAYEIEQAKLIYSGRLEQWVGDFSDEPIL